MNVEVSTINVFLVASIALHCWIVKQLISLRSRITRLETLMDEGTKFWRKDNDR